MDQASTRRRDGPWAGTVALMVLCCAVAPAVVGAVAGSLIGGWLGILVAVACAAVFALVLHRRRARGRC